MLLDWCAHGYGRHAIQIPMDQFIRGLKDRYAIFLVGNISIMLPKYSVLFFYARIFGAKSKTFKISLWATAVLVTAILLYGLTVTIFQCTPIRKTWLVLTVGHCRDDYNSILAATVCNVVIDGLILILPLPLLWKLHTGRARKMNLTIVFICGYW